MWPRNCWYLSSKHSQARHQGHHFLPNLLHSAEGTNSERSSVQITTYFLSGCARTSALICCGRSLERKPVEWGLPSGNGFTLCTRHSTAPVYKYTINSMAVLQYHLQPSYRATRLTAIILFTIHCTGSDDRCRLPA